MAKETKLMEIFNEYNELFENSDLSGEWVMFLGWDNPDDDRPGK